jgi:CDP-glycerol glycerophosphotransferase
VQADISVIIPTYNVEKFIVDTLNSISTQTFEGKIEVIVIDDCSTDNTVEKINEFILANPKMLIKFIQQPENMRQGTARNRGVLESSGKYVFFLDGDDFIDSDTLSSLYEKAELYACDFVLCDWAYYYEDKGLVYVNNDKFLFQDILVGKEVEALLMASTYFSVNKLYNKEFLTENDIKYGEGYIYEDFEFYIKVAQCANMVGVISNPYYRVRVNEYSTTKTNTKSTLHVDSLIKAIDSSIAQFKPRAEFSYYHTYKYLMRKTLTYISKRAPRRHKRRTLSKVVEILNSNNTEYLVPKNVVPLYHFLFRRKYVQNSKVNRILLVWWLHSSGLLRPMFAFAHSIKWKIFNSKLGVKLRSKRRANKVKSFYNKPIEKDTILFLGFDYRYSGNSKYFFDYLRKRDDLNIFFVTKDLQVPKKFRIPPRSMKFYEVLAKAKVVLVESWVPLAFEKREGSTWIQLWHGTPYKKLFFDSHEYYISSLNRNHKKNKQQDIRRWDYLLADSREGLNKLSSAFVFEKENILEYGYPRVQWLKENKNNTQKKEKIREGLNIPANKKVIMYAPTWRDYNYKTNNVDLSYLLDIHEVSEKLKEYVIIYKEHSMGKQQRYNDNIIIPSDEIETQKLILISDIIISDYSSIIFDGMAIDIPFFLFINDFERYEKARGVYKDIHHNFGPFITGNEKDLVKNINELTDCYPFSHYNKAKTLYSNVYGNSNQLLETKIIEEINTDKFKM